MTKIAMYTTSQLFGNRITGGLRRFLELYNGLINHVIAVDLFSTDTLDVLKENNIMGFSMEHKNISKNILIPTGLLIFIKNFNIISELKKNKYDKVIVFDVPAAIGLCLAGVNNIQLFIRQDLLSYKKITLIESTNNRLVISIYLAFIKLCEAFCLLKADKLIIQCEYDYNELIKRHRFIKKSIRSKSVIQINNVNPSWIVDKSNEVSEEFPDFSDLDKNITYYIGFIGDFSSERKGQRILIDAIKQIAIRNIAISAIIIGDGKNLENYQNECKDYPNIKFTGRLKNPLTIIKKCNLLVVPSLADSCPNTVMEALYNEIPVIGASSGGIPEILKDKDALFNPTPEELGNAIIHFMEEENLRELLQKQRERKGELTFNWSEKMIEHMGI